MGKCNLEHGLKKRVLVGGTGLIWLSKDTGTYVLTPLACVPRQILAFEYNVGAGRWKALNGHPFPPPRHSSIDIKTALQTRFPNSVFTQ